MHSSKFNNRIYLVNITMDVKKERTKPQPEITEIIFILKQTNITFTKEVQLYLNCFRIGLAAV